MGILTPNFNAIIDDRKTITLTKDLIRRIRESTYIDVGEFFKNINDHDLRMILGFIYNQDDEGISQIMLLATVLCQGEGVEVNDDNIMDVTNTTMLLFACERLQREGLVEIDRKFMTIDRLIRLTERGRQFKFGSEMGKKRTKKIVIVEPKKRNHLIPHLMQRNGGGKHRDRKRESKNSHQE